MTIKQLTLGANNLTVSVMALVCVRINFDETHKSSKEAGITFIR
jgi:hypothetical protein